MRAQLGNGVRCIYAAVGASATRIGEVLGMLQGPAGVLDPAITVVTVYGNFDVILGVFFLTPFLVSVLTLPPHARRVVHSTWCPCTLDVGC